VHWRIAESEKSYDEVHISLFSELAIIDKDIPKPLPSNCDAKTTPPAQKCNLSRSKLNVAVYVAVYFWQNIFWDEPVTHKATFKDGKGEEK